MKLEKGKGLRFGCYSNSPNFLDLLSFQTTLVIGAKINKMCCPTKENICFFLVGQTFLLSFRWFNCLAEILLIFGRNKLCPLFVNFAIGHNTFLPFMTDEKRQGAACRKGFRQICFLPLFCVSAILSKVWISARQFFRFFFFDVFPSLGGGSKSRIVCRRRSRSYSGGDKSLTRLPPTPSTTCLPKPKEKCTPACRSKPERQTSYLSFSIFVFYR